MTKHACLIDDKEFELVDGNFVHEVDPYIKGLIKIEHPKVKNEDFICNDHLVKYRMKKLNKMISDDTKHTSHLGKKMGKLMSKTGYEIVDVDKQLQDTMTFGQKVADRVAKFGGSWTFLIGFIIVLVGWITINALHLFGANFDPFPFILLNLFLSMVSALQAPLIMMSQNRAGEYDRMNSKNDYHINLKSEEEIRILHSKLDHLIQEDQPNNLHIQKMQMEELDKISKQLAKLDEK